MVNDSENYISVLAGIEGFPVAGNEPVITNAMGRLEYIPEIFQTSFKSAGKDLVEDGKNVFITVVWLLNRGQLDISNFRIHSRKLALNLPGAESSTWNGKFIISAPDGSEHVFKGSIDPAADAFSIVNAADSGAWVSELPENVEQFNYSAYIYEKWKTLGQIDLEIQHAETNLPVFKVEGLTLDFPSVLSAISSSIPILTTQMKNGECKAVVN